MSIVNISDELYQELKDLLNKENVTISLNEFVEHAVNTYVDDLEEGKTYYQPDPELLAELLEAEAEAEAEEAAGIGMTSDELLEDLGNHIGTLAAQKHKVSA